ncbi:MAG: hypothetical protein ACI8XW_001079, partial [Gammaproteobacteria bacterium]
KCLALTEKPCAQLPLNGSVAGEESKTEPGFYSAIAALFSYSKDRVAGHRLTFCARKYFAAKVNYSILVGTFL